MFLFYIIYDFAVKKKDKGAGKRTSNRYSMTLVREIKLLPKSIYYAINTLVLNLSHKFGLISP
jgi:hypothetical protein